MDLELTTITDSVIIAAAPEDVYDAYLDAKQQSAFTGSKATGDGKVGGKFTAWDGYIFGKNLVLEKGKRILQEWKTTEWPEGYPPSKLELTFKKVKGGTELSMVHSDVPTEQAEDYRQGWVDFYWKPLRKYFKR